MYYQKLLKAANFIQKRAKNGHFWGSNVNKFNIFELISDNENQIIWRHY